jgi:hypothetical protein
MAEALGMVRKGATLRVMVANRPKVSFSPESSTSPGTYDASGRSNLGFSNEGFGQKKKKGGKKRKELRVIVNGKYFLVGRHSVTEGMQNFVTEITILINFLQNEDSFPPALPFFFFQSYWRDPDMLVHNYFILFIYLLLINWPSYFHFFSLHTIVFIIPQCQIGA